MSYLIQSLVGTMTSLMLAQPMDFTRKNCLPPVELYEKLKPSVVKILVKTPKYEASGTGLVIDSLGTIVSATHVVKGAQQILVVDSETGEAFSYKTYKKGDPESVSVLKPTTHKHPEHYTLLDKTPLSPGEEVFVIGNPFEYRNLFSAGYYMGSVNYGGRDYLMTSALLNPGSSGGPAFDCEAHVQGFVLGADMRAEPIGILNPVQDALDLLSGGH